MVSCSSVAVDKWLALPDVCRALMLSAGNHNLFMHPDWFALLAKYSLSSHETASYAFATSEGRGAVLPLVGSSDHPTIKRSQTNFYTPFFTPVFSDAEILRDLACGIQKDQTIERIILEPLPQGAALDVVNDAFAGAGFRVFPFFRFGNWYLRTDGRSFDDYFKQRAGQMRNTIRRKRAKLQRAGQLEIRIFSRTDEVAQATNAYWQVYNSSWKQKEAFPEFINAFIDWAAENGWLRLGIVYLSGKPVAAQLWLVAGGVASIYKLAYDDAFGDYSPGSILSYEMFRRAFDEDRVREIDYLVGDDDYKKDWMEYRREMWGLLIINPSTWRGKWSVFKERVKRAFRRSSP